jgi:hypothetical protein
VSLANGRSAKTKGQWIVVDVESTLFAVDCLVD